MLWKDINGWEEYYEVSDSGDVRNKITGHCIVGDRNSEGYDRVTLYHTVDGKQRHQRFFRHRLVAEHFIPNPSQLREVNHIDCNIHNNTVRNLEWCSKVDNELHSRMYGSKEYKPFCVEFSDGRTETFNAKSELADLVGVTRGAVKHWLHGLTLGYRKHGINNIKYI